MKVTNWIRLLFILGLACSPLPSANAGSASIIYEEHFDSDVIAAGDWVASDPTVSVDIANGLLHIATGGGLSDYADKSINLTLPVTIEARMRLVSAGQNYTLPGIVIYNGSPIIGDGGITYLPSDQFAQAEWKFIGEWNPGISTLGPQSEGEWRTIRALIDTDGGSLFAKRDEDNSFTFILDKSWSIGGQIDKIRFSQPWDAVCDLDFIRVLSGVDASDWCEGFEAYAPGSLPFPPWFDGGGNTSGIAVDGTVSHTGGSSLRMFGQIGGCWAATMARPFTGFPLMASMSIRNGSEALFGCHQVRGAVTLRTGGPQWPDCPCPVVYRFLENGDLQVDFPPENPTVISGFPLEQWHDIALYMWLPGDGSLHLRLWANGTPLGEFMLPEEPWMHSPAYFDLSSQEGAAWFDDVCVSTFSSPACAPPPSACNRDEEDVNNSGMVDIVDVVRVVNVAFRAVPAVPDSCNSVTVP